MSQLNHSKKETLKTTTFLDTKSIIKRFCQLALIAVFCLLFAYMIQLTAFAAEGELIYDKVHSPALEGNLLGDSADRDVIVYLPPSYETSQEKRYPVVYLLHGYNMHAADWINWGPTYSNLNRFMSQNPNHEMMVVMPDAYNKYLGSWFVNSSVTGKWGDFIAQDLVQYIDTNYRILPQKDSRAITGASMGATGAWILGMKYPEVYSALYGLSGGVSIDKDPWFQDDNTWRTVLSLKNMTQFSESNNVNPCPNLIFLSL